MRPKLKFFAVLLGTFLGLVPGLNAKPIYLYNMTNLYPGSRLAAGCSICHTVGKEYTSYGQDFLRLKLQIGADNMDKVWYELGRLDSDNDGVDNDTEIRRDRYPQKDERRN